MGLTKKIINGVGKMGKAFTTENNIANGGGLSSILVPRKLNLKGGVAAIGVVGGATVISEGFKGNSRARMGKISYGDGMARMTDSFNSGVVGAMHQASGGDPEVFSDMASGVLKSPTLSGRIDDFGANPGMISALYNMGGR